MLVIVYRESVKTFPHLLCDLSELVYSEICVVTLNRALIFLAIIEFNANH